MVIALGLRMLHETSPRASCRTLKEVVFPLPVAPMRTAPCLT